MEKILDYLNGRDFRINTIEGAKKAAEHFISVQSSLMMKTEVAVSNIEGFLKTYKPVSVSKEEMVMATYLAMIGNSPELMLSSFAPYDAHTYLKYNSWNENVCNLVLLQNMARELSASKSPELYHIFMEKEQKVDWSDVMVYSLALTGKPINNSTNKVEVDSYKQWANKIYEKDSPEKKHSVLLLRMFLSNDNTLKLIQRSYE